MSPVLLAVRSALSPARFQTYELACNGDSSKALQLYAWNAEVSSSLLHPMHVVEVALRNAVADAIAAIHGNNWPWNPGFERSLPNGPQYSPKKDLISARCQPSVGKVIPELKFAFWQRMFTSRHIGRIWTTELSQVMPNMDPTLSVLDRVDHLFNSIKQVRELRNRVAHHEPIFHRNLISDYDLMVQLVRYRCNHTANWLEANQTAKALIAMKP